MMNNERLLNGKIRDMLSRTVFDLVLFQYIPKNKYLHCFIDWKATEEMSITGPGPEYKTFKFENMVGTLHLLRSHKTVRVSGYDVQLCLDIIPPTEFTLAEDLRKFVCEDFLKNKLCTGLKLQENPIPEAG